MKRLKSDETLDRLSELDDSMIFVILSFLPMRDVVRTTILSKRWKDLWFTLPTLNFFEHNKTSVDSRNFINRALMLWKGTQIQKMEFGFGRPFDGSLFADIDLWVCFAKERNVEQLSIQIPYAIPPADYWIYQPPQCLYSCSSLRKLSLLECNLEIRGNVHWHHLKSLELHVHKFSVDMISQVVSSSPQLEILVLRIFEKHGNMTFRSSSLRVLSVYTTVYEPSVLTISTPKLETLLISGGPCCERFLIDAPSVTDLTLDFMDEYIEELRASLRQIVVAFHRLESVTLSVYSYKILAAMKGKCLIPPLMNVKLLRFRCDPNPIKPNEIVRLLEIFPKVERLLIHWKYDDETTFFERQMLWQDSVDWFNFDGENCSERSLAGLLEQLKIVEITWSYFYDVFVFQFVELLLKHAPVIEKIVIQRSGDEEIESKDMFTAAQKLLSLQRSFPNVEIVFCQI